MAECKFGDIKCGVGNAVGNLADSVVADFAENVAEGVTAVMQFLSTWWVDTPAPDTQVAAVLSLQQDLAWYTGIFAVLGFLVGLIRLVMSQDVKQSGISIAKPLVNLVLATGAYGVGLPYLIMASDGLATWILERTNEGDPDFTQLVANTQLLLTSPGLALIITILLLLASVVNYCFMLFRNVMFLVLMAFIPTVAAASGTEAGGEAWRKANGWLLALLLFKPVAAGIYSLGFRVTMQGTGAQDDSLGGALSSTLTGFLILTLAALALPALIKFVVPAAGAGSSAFSGGAAVAGAATVAAGAAVIAATGGAGAGAMAAGRGAATTTGGAATATGSTSSSASQASGGAASSGGSTAASGGAGKGSGETSSGSGGSAGSSGAGATGPGNSSSGSSGGASSPSSGGGGSGGEASTRGSQPGQSGSNVPAGSQSQGAESSSGAGGAQSPSGHSAGTMAQKAQAIQNVAGGAKPSHGIDDEEDRS